MDRAHLRWYFQRLGILFCLLLFSACSQRPDGVPSSTALPTHTISTPTQAATPLTSSTTSQTCPKQARTATMPSLPPDNQSSLVYVSQQNNSSTLQRYDITTGSQQAILQTQKDGIIQTANVSPDGQWLLLQSMLQGQAAIQLIRLDGQKMQTLYCAPPQSSIGDALLSPDQRALVFNQESQDGMSTLYLLDLATGKLRTLLSPLQPDYPGVAQVPSQSPMLSEHAPATGHDTSTTPLFNPLSSSHYLVYVPMKWANNTSLYLYGTIRASGVPPHQLALLRDIRKDSAQQGSNLQFFSTGGQNVSCQDDDVTPDNTQLLCSSYTLAGPASLSGAIKTWPLTGRAQHTLYQELPGTSIIARAISNTTLIFLFNQTNGSQALWKINRDGSGLAQLMVAPKKNMVLRFASSSYLPWSITSRDGRYYALTAYDLTNNTSSLLIGNLAGGQSKTIVSGTSLMLLAGWG